jgi:DNA-directed RNA polymerase subunit beta'
MLLLTSKIVLRGVEVSALKRMKIVESLGERILGRVALQDVINPLTNEFWLNLEQITEAIRKYYASPIEKVEVRSPYL